MNKIISYLITIILLTCLVLEAKAVTNTGASFLKINIGARAVGMGSAFTAVANDVSAIQWNPAGLSLLTGREFSAMHSEWIVDTKLDFLGFAFPLRTGVVGGSIIYLSHPEMEGRSETREKVANFDASDLAVIFGYSKRVIFSGKEMASFGLNVKLIRQQIELESAYGAAFDIGLLSHFSLFHNHNPLSIGLCIQNIGAQMKFVNEPYDLPLSVTAGLGYNIGALTIAFDIKQLIYENKTVFNFGTEFVPINMFALRAGYLLPLMKDREIILDSKYDELTNLNGISAGLGLRLFGIQTDYSFVPYGILGSTHIISLSMKF